MESLHLAEGNPMRFGQVFIALDPAGCSGAAVYGERVETLVEAMVADEGVRLPGARRADARTRAARSGIEIADTLYRELEALASQG